MSINPQKDLERIYSNYKNKKAEDNAKFFAQPLPLKIIDICFALTVGALTWYIVEKQIWPAGFFIHNHLNAQGEFPEKLIWFETFLCVCLPFFPIRYGLKKIVRKKEE